MHLILRDKKFMNTTITIKAVQNNEATVDIMDAIERAYGEFDRIVKQYTRFDESSELSNLNRNSGTWVKISGEFFDLVKYMLDLADQTDGAFDPTIIDFLDVYGYNKNYDYSNLENPELNKIIDERAKNRPSWNEIELDPEGKRVKLSKDQRIDLGGVGKGYAIDCAYNQLLKTIPNFLIDAGGDLRSSGTNEEGTLWSVGLKSMSQEEVPEVIGGLTLDNEAVASSGSWARKVKQFHHLINPKTGLPENQFRTVYVQAKSAIDADAWATALFVGGDSITHKMPEQLKHYVVRTL